MSHLPASLCACLQIVHAQSCGQVNLSQQALMSVQHACATAAGNKGLQGKAFSFDNVHKGFTRVYKERPSVLTRFTKGLQPQQVTRVYNCRVYKGVTGSHMCCADKHCWISQCNENRLVYKELVSASAMLVSQPQQVTMTLCVCIELCTILWKVRKD